MRVLPRVKAKMLTLSAWSDAMVLAGAGSLVAAGFTVTLGLGLTVLGVALLALGFVASG